MPKKIIVPMWVGIIAIAIAVFAFLIILNPSSKLISLSPVKSPKQQCTAILEDKYTTPRNPKVSLHTIVAKNEIEARAALVKIVQASACVWKGEEGNQQSGQEQGESLLPAQCATRDTTDEKCIVDVKTKVTCQVKEDDAVKVANACKLNKQPPTGDKKKTEGEDLTFIFNCGKLTTKCTCEVTCMADPRQKMKPVTTPQPKVPTTTPLLPTPGR